MLFRSGGSGARPYRWPCRSGRSSCCRPWRSRRLSRVAAVQNGGQIHESDPRADVGDVPDPFEPGGLGGGSPCPPGRGGRRCRPARCGGADPCGAAQRLTGPFSRMRGGGGVSGDTTVPLRFRAAAGRRYPQNHVGGLELGLDQQCQLPPSDLRGGLGPAQPVASGRTSILRPVRTWRRRGNCLLRGG